MTTLLLAATLLNPDLPTLWLIGDSTVRNGTAGQMGWGDPLIKRFDPAKIQVVNRAIGGRSSRTFITDGRWDQILQEAKPGDLVAMQFGHNDPAALNDDSRARGTIRGIGAESEEIENLLTKKHETVHTYGWYLRKIIQEAKAAGMTPIVLSYVPRCPAAGAPVGPTPETSSYRFWAQQVADQERVAYVDLFELVWTEYRKYSAEEVKTKFFCTTDNTHTNEEGATLNAAKVFEGLKSLKIKTLDSATLP